jgi:hypothetical protein
MKKSILFGAISKRERWGLSKRGWFVIFVGVIVGGAYAVRSVQPFLGMNEPIHGEILVIEGWVADYALEKAIKIYHGGRYRKIVTTGVEIEKGFLLSRYKTEAELAAVRLRELGISDSEVVAVPAPPEIRIDRTSESARAFAAWLSTAGGRADSIDIFTLGAHARRSRLLFARALGDSVHIGIMSCEDRRYDPEAWWTTSVGFREVTSELIAYLYVRAKFWR